MACVMRLAQHPLPGASECSSAQLSSVCRLLCHASCAAWAIGLTISLQCLCCLIWAVHPAICCSNVASACSLSCVHVMHGAAAGSQSLMCALVGRWTRQWTSEENRHGDLMNKYIYLSGRVNMRVRPCLPARHKINMQAASCLQMPRLCSYQPVCPPWVFMIVSADA